MAAHYSRLNPVQRSDPSQEYLNPDLNDVPLSNMAGHGIPMSSDGSVNDYFGKADQTNVRSRPICKNPSPFYFKASTNNEQSRGPGRTRG